MRYEISKLSNTGWRWEVFTPACVLGLFGQAGVIDGEVADPIRAARSAIEFQTRLNLQIESGGP